MAQTVLVEEGVDALTISTGADGIGDVVFVGTEELGQAVTVEVGIGIDMV